MMIGEHVFPNSSTDINSDAQPGALSFRFERAEQHEVPGEYEPSGPVWTRRTVEYLLWITI